MNKKLKIILIVIGIVVASLLISFGAILLLSSGFNDKYDITTDTAKYNDVIVGKKWELSEEIFPKDIKKLNVIDFKHVYYDPWDANYLAYLVIDYNEEEYSKEIERLNDYGINKYIDYYSVKGFSKYELVAMEADSYNGFVYAITDGKSRIIYVELIFCNYYMDIDYEKQIPNEYLPDGFNAKNNNPYQKKKIK